MAAADARSRVVLKPPETAAAPTDEMLDSERDLARPTPLGDYLRFCRAELLPAFEKADRKALDDQRRHRALVRWIAFAGTGAVLFALAQSAVPGESESPWPFALLVIEGTAVVLTGLLVAAGLFSYRQQKWLLGRYRAERLRLLKFEFLSDPRTWMPPGAGEPDWRERFRREIAEIGALKQEDLTAMSQRGEIPALPSPQASAAVPAERLSELVAYYEERRLGVQITYFHRAAEGATPKPLLSSRLVPTVFFLSVLGVLIHLALEIASLNPRKGFLGVVSLGSIALTAMLPALWKGLRAYRSANELPRNASRSVARHASLTQISGRLREAADARTIFTDLAFSEYILASDQQEWLRLMLGAKWYG